MNENSPQQQPMMQIECSTCKNPMMVRVPAMRLYNAPDVSSIMWTHPKPDRCPGCGTQYLNMLQGIDPEGKIILAWVPIDTGQSAILAPTPENMAAAKAAQEMAGKIKLA